jgi:hypothetical protein
MDSIEFCHNLLKVLVRNVGAGNANLLIAVSGLTD